MEFQWAVVFFPFPEYSVCEDSVTLNVEIFRRGNINVSSYVTVTSIEQTAKEGLDFVSRRINKIQFDPGMHFMYSNIFINCCNPSYLCLSFHNIGYENRNKAKCILCVEKLNK